jgi:hypothetical protein
VAKQPDHSVIFDRRERDVLELILYKPEAIAGLLEIGKSTVRARLAAMCDRARVADQGDLVEYILTHPECATQGGAAAPGLHAQPCPCRSPFCLGAIAAGLRRT